MKYLLILLLGVSVHGASLTNSYFKNIISSGFLTLSGLTNQITDDGAQMLYNGNPISTSTSTNFLAITITNNISFKTNIVTGTTPTISAADKGFTAITLTGNTTITLADVPTDGRLNFQVQVTDDGTHTLVFAGVSITDRFGLFASPPRNGITIYNFDAIGAVLYRDTIAPLTVQDIYDAGGASASSTNTFTNKTYDSAGAGNVLTMIDWKDFVYPARVDGTGVTIVTNDYSSSLWGLATHAGTGGTNVNYALYRVGTTPLVLASGVEMTLRNLAFRVSATDTGSASFSIGFYSPASSAAYMPTDFTALSSYVNFTTGTLTSPAANDIFYFSDVTLTGWAAGLTAGRPLIIGIARDGTDANNDSITIVGGTIEYTGTR